MAGEVRVGRPTGATITPDTRWMTYKEMADFLGMKEESARRRSQREGWPRQLGNDGRTRVGVPGDAIALEAVLSGETDGGGDHPGEVAALREALARERERADRAEAAGAAVQRLADRRGEELAEARERAGRAEGERDALQGALQAARATAEEATQRARAAEDRAAAAHQRAAEITAVMGRVAEGLEHFRQAQATAAEAIAAAKAEREAALARVEEAAQRAGEAEARVMEASRRAEAAEARLEELQHLQAEAPAPDTAELEAAQARAAEAERQAAEARRQADEAERRASVANERLDRFQRERINRAQADAERQGREAAERELAARKAGNPFVRVLRALAGQRGRA